MIIDPYIRVSTEEQAHDGVSLDEQIAKIRSYHSLYGKRENLEFTLGEVVVDAGVSAKTLKKRAGIKTILERLDSGASQGVIVSKLDRLTRELGDWNDLVEDYFGEKPGKRLIAVDNEVNTMTANGRAMLNMIVLMAQWERETISERTRSALRHKIARGERCGKVRYGHALDWNGPINKKGRPVNLLIEPAEQAVIALMVTLRSEGRSLQAIADELVARGYPTRDGGPSWSAWTIAKILKRAS